MHNINVSKKAISVFVAVVLIAVVGFASCSGNTKKKDSNPYQSSILVPTTSRPLRTQVAPDRNTTIPTYKIEPFSASARQALYKLPTTGSINPSSPGTYMSPRYEGIIGGDTSSGVPISELDNPLNSDLDEATFKLIRDTAIEITRAQITGEGSAKYPNYFNDGNQPGTCSAFKLKNAGATTLPIPNDPRWIVSILFWKATCGSSDSGFYKVEQQTSVYFTLSNGTLIPRQYNEVPGV